MSLKNKIKEWIYRGRQTDREYVAMFQRGMDSTSEAAEAKLYCLESVLRSTRQRHYQA